MKPLVGIIMGSDSDLSVMQEAAKVLEEFGVDFEMTVCSAHRTPARAHEFASTASSRGLKVIIASAGGAAHLAGVMAANTILPVIGVPINWKLNGLDSLLSTAQMPPGVPVATMGIDGAKNAGLLAVQILATSDNELANKMVDYKKKMEEQINSKGKKLEEMGYKKYLEAK
ncbi:MAG TPA: 5-(carboxyamino)imidazole ribonucleotide mutase [Candidatus Limnocylindria bacterium]|nr:5-(carboxyamino)imidazole ribonucleotide mutase [Candidatus Limnocylindria bacterium]